jgi:hypothetical protein
MDYEISPEAIMAIAVIAADRSEKEIKIEDVSRLFFEIRQRGFNEVERVALRRVPGGSYYSDDVDAFFGRLLAAGYARQRSPVRVEPAGVGLCREILNKEMESHSEALSRIAKSLGLESVLATLA